MSEISEIIVAGASALSAGVALIAALSAEGSKRAATTAQASARKAWVESAQALKEANELTAAHHRETQSVQAAAARAPYARLLDEVSAELISARMVGKTYEEVRDIAMARSPELHAPQFATLDVTAPKITLWVMEYSRKAEFMFGDVDRLMEMNRLVSDRVRGWVFDPDAVLAQIRADPPIPGGPERDPADPHDFRNP